MAAVSLGVFEALAHGPRDAAAVAAELKLDVEALELFLRCMVWAGYAEQRGNRFNLTKLSRQTMVAGVPMDMTGFLQWNYVQWRMVERMMVLKVSPAPTSMRQKMDRA